MDPFLALVVSMVVIILFVAFLLLYIWGRMLRKVGPNEALIVSQGNRVEVVTGGTKFVFPLTQRIQELSLELMSVHLAPRLDFVTADKIAVNIEAEVLVRVRSNAEEILKAASLFLSKSQVERENLICLVMAYHLRRVVQRWIYGELMAELEMVESTMIEASTPDMNKMGLQVFSFMLMDVQENIPVEPEHSESQTYEPRILDIMSTHTQKE